MTSATSASSRIRRSRILPACGLLFLACLSHATAQEYIVTTVAGRGLPLTPMPGPLAPLDNTLSVAADAAGNVYFTAYNCVFKLDPAALMTRVAGRSQVPGYSGDGGPATGAEFSGPTGLAVDAAGNLYMADFGNHVVRKVTADGIISTVAGSGVSGYSGDNGLATSAKLAFPNAVATDAAGNLYISDSANQRIRKVSPAGIISTVAGNGSQGYSGDNVPAINATLSSPNGLAVDTAGNLYISDSGNNRIRKVALNGIISTVAGTGAGGYSGDGGPATSAKIFSPYGVAIDAAGNLLIADNLNSRVRAVSPSGVITTVAGNGFGTAGDSWLSGFPALDMGFNARAIATDTAGNFYIATFESIGKIGIDGILTKLAGNFSYPNGGDGGPASNAQFGINLALGLDPAGNLYIADYYNNQVRKIGTDGVINTVAGNGSSGSAGDGGPAVNASVSNPLSVAMDAAGSMYIGEPARIRKVSVGGTITTIAGTGTQGYSGDNGPAANAQVMNPQSIAFDAAGNLYFADTGNARVRRIGANGIVTTIAGTGVYGYSGDNGPAVNAQLAVPSGLTFDAGGSLYIGDAANNRVRRVATDGTITTVAGDGTAGSSGDNGPAVNAKLQSPGGVAVDASGNLFILDRGNSRIRRVTAGIISAVAPNWSADPPQNFVLDSSGNIYVAAWDTVQLLVPAGGNPVLSAVKSHAANFTAGQIGATYTVVVGNHVAAGPTSGTVTVNELIPAGLTLQNMTGTSWNCPATACTRSDPLAPGASYPPITVTVNVSADAPIQMINQVTITGGHAISTGATDATTVPGVPNPVLVSSSNGALSVPLAATLSWTASFGATSYDVYFGTASSPPLLASNIASTTYLPGGIVANATYYWRIVAKNGARSATSAVWSFRAVQTQIQISGSIAPGIPVSLSGSQSATTTSDSTGNFAFTV
jgi:sugar lactone lactonase YvrE